ncbi:MAG: two-component system LytT family response regulator [Cyclobacteriaceae bacterium]|jgi:two-component system LytT family response regulator
MKKILKCIIVEDDPMAAGLLEQYIESADGLHHIGTHPDSLMASLNIQRQKPDVVFLDINISGLDGPEMISLLDHKPQIIITSGIDKNSFVDYDIDIIDFLSKPITLKSFHKAVEKCIENSERTTNPC